MKKKVLVGTAVAAVAVAGAVTGGALAFAGGAGDDDDTRVTGPEADRAAEAAVTEAGGGTASSVEREDEGAVAWEVEVTRADGTKVEVDLDASYAVVASEADAEESDETDSSEPETEDADETKEADEANETDEANEPDDDATTTTTG